MKALRLAFLPALVLLTVAAVQAPPPPEPWRPPAGMVLWSVGGADAPVTVPLAFARGAIPIVACEDRAHQGSAAVGDDGHSLGAFQINDQHHLSMADLGLDYHRERDRVQFAVLLWRERGERFTAWTCGR